MNQRQFLSLIALPLVLSLGVSISAHAQALVYMKAGGDPKRAANVRYSATTKEYILDIDSVEIAVAVADVDRIELPRPKALDTAEKQLAAGQYAAAIPVLQKIAADFTMLTWDTVARELMMEAYAKSGDATKAMATYKELVRKASGGRISANARMTYWNLMLTAGKMEEVAPELESVIATGSHEEAASAQLTRANLRRAQNKTQDALLDYLRTALLYEDVPAVQPEALFKAAEMMDAQRDPRAPDLRHRLVEKYPDSDYAKKAGQM